MVGGGDSGLGWLLIEFEKFEHPLYYFTLALLHGTNKLGTRVQPAKREFLNYRFEVDVWEYEVSVTEFFSSF